MKNKFVCPMHPEMTSDHPDRCSICGMELVENTRLEAQKAQNEKDLGQVTWKNYLPLLIVIVLILGTAKAISFNDYLAGNFTVEKFITYFMIGFFLVFGGFKLLDLKGFAQGYKMYDLLAKKVPVYGYTYPFIELFFAYSMIMNFAQREVLWAEVIVMTFSGFGVLLKILKREKFQCVCLGTTLKVPLTTITLVEDFGMAALALAMLFVFN